MNKLPFDKIIQHDTALSVIWQIGKRCNYECFYCNDDLHDKISPDVDIIILKKIYDRIKQQYSGNINFSITGGEPTLHPNLIEFCKYISFSSAGVSPISSLISKAYSFKAKNLGSLYFAIGAFPDL